MSKTKEVMAEIETSSGLMTIYKVLGPKKYLGTLEWIQKKTYQVKVGRKIVQKTLQYDELVRYLANALHNAEHKAANVSFKPGCV